MANNIALGLVIGGAVSPTVGAAFKDVEGRIKHLEAQGTKARVLQRTIGDTIRLRDEWKKANDSGAAGAGTLLRKLESNLSSLKKQGVEVRNLAKAYQTMGQVARKSELKAVGHSQIKEGKEGLSGTIGRAAAATAVIAIPTKISADYQTQIRQMSLWAHTAGTDAEQQMADKISQVAAKKGMGQQALARAVGGLIEKGIDWEESVDYAPLIADLVDGQGMEAETVATLFSAFKEAGVKKADMGAMLGQVAAAGDIGAFGPKDMAKYMPALLGTIKRLGMEGPEAVRFLGASLQSQFSQTQDAAAAATNMNNLLNAVISSTSQERFAKEGYDLAGSILAATNSGKAANPVDAFIMLSEKLIAKQDPKKAKRVEALKAKIQASKDGSVEEEQAMVALIEAAGLATIVSDQSASDGLLAQIKYGSKIKQDMSTIKDTDGRVKIEQDAARARETSNAKWSAATASMEASMTSVGNALRPLTDMAADGLTKVGNGLSKLAEKFPEVVSGTTVAVGAIGAVVTAFSAFKMGKGLFNLARGSLGGKDKDIQKVFVTNAEDGPAVDGGRTAPKGKAGVALSLVETGLKTVAAIKGKAQGDDGPDTGKETGGFDVVSTGLKVVSLIQDATGDNDNGGAGGEVKDGVQRVFVVNSPVIGGGNKRGQRRGRGSNRASSQRRRPAGNTRPTRPPVPVRPARPAIPPRPPVPMPAAPGMLSKLGGAVGKVGQVGKLFPGGALLESGAMAFDTFQNAETQDEKAEGYGAAAGSLAGTMAGAAAGAAIGSVVPIIGTAVGGMIGAYLGSLGGTALGGVAGKSWFGADAPEKPAAPITPLVMAARPGPAVPALSSIGQSFAPVLPMPAPHAPRVPDSNAVLLRSQLANKAGVEESDLERPKIAPPEPAPKLGSVVRPVSVPPVAQPVPNEPRRSDPNGALLLPPKAVAPEPDAKLGDVVRSLTVPPAAKPAVVTLQPRAPGKPVPAKVDQKFEYSLSMPVAVHGDVKDPYRLAQELMPHMQRMLADAAKLNAASNLFDQPHL
ncbi:phage tail tape measure protein [Pseudomonas sp. FW300-N1A1]|uniref:phage tail tape measure protein n=1 Tax=Pseudomonas sp. FW300-N1A1 TaxID=2075555 RepID=UPI0021159EA9|nr:phage tail tape measure protein [Pseudomonas sp. FW300-N1A1]